MLPKADYTALGHIHTPQALGDNIYYSGAITELSVGQKDLGVNIFETEHGKIISCENVKLKNIARYEKVSANSIADAEEKLSSFDDSDIVELEIVQNEPLSASEVKALRKAFSCILTISLVRKFEDSETEHYTNRRHLTDEELFKEFYKSVRGVEPATDLTELFIMCKGEEDEAN